MVSIIDYYTLQEIKPATVPKRSKTISLISHLSGHVEDHLKPGFDDMFSSCGKKEHVEMCICDFVFQRYGKSTYGFRIFRHLSCSVCIILTYSLENGD